MRGSRHFLMVGALAVIFASFNAAADDASPAATPTIYGLGTQSCGDYLDARKGGDQSLMNLYESWLQGFLTHASLLYVLLNKKPANFLAGTDLVAAMYWLENYCHAHPTDDFAVATVRFAAFQAAQMNAPK